MKRILLTMVVCALMAAPALASPTITVSRTSGTYPTVPALSGEFTLTPNGELMAITAETGPFQSFCLETLESIIIGNTYDVLVSTEAILGDGRWPGELPGPGGGDVISPETAYLYTQFRLGTLSGYNYTLGLGREASARNLQTAIWYLEQETGYTNWGVLSPEAQAFVTLTPGTWTGIGNVRVLNVYDPISKQPMQDMLVMVVPAPGAVLLGSIGVAFVGWLRRRRTL